MFRGWNGWGEGCCVLPLPTVREGSQYLPFRSGGRVAGGRITHPRTPERAPFPARSALRAGEISPRKGVVSTIASPPPPQAAPVVNQCLHQLVTAAGACGVPLRRHSSPNPRRDHVPASRAGGSASTPNPTTSYFTHLARWPLTLGELGPRLSESPKVGSIDPIFSWPVGTADH